MSVQPNFEERNFSGEGLAVRRTEVECKINPDEEIKKVLAVKGTASSVGEEITDGEIRFSGRAVFQIVYESESGALRKTECGVEFSNKAECDAAGIRYADYSVSDEEIKFVNGSYVVNASVTTEIVTETTVRASVFTGGEDILCDYEDKEFSSVAGCGRGVLQTDDEFELNYPVKDIVAHTETVSLTEVKSGLGVVILDGTVFLSMTVLQNTEKNDIIKESRGVPFRLELEMPAASPEMQAYARAAVAKSAFKVVVDEEKNSSTVIVSVDLDAYACVTQTHTEKFVRDAYSPINELAVTVADFTAVSATAGYCINERVSGKTDFNADGREVVAVICERVEGVSVNAENGTINGLLTATVIYDEQGSLAGERAVMPFEVPHHSRAAPCISPSGWRVSITASGLLPNSRPCSG